MNKSNRKWKFRELLLLFVPVLVLVGLGIFFQNRPVPPDDAKVEAIVKEVVITRFVGRSPAFAEGRKQDFLKISVAAGYQGAKPTWWGQLPVTINFEKIVVATSDGLTTYKSESDGPANFDAESGLFRRNCDIPIFKQDGNVDGGTLKLFVRVQGGGYRPREPNYEVVILSGQAPVTMNIPAK